MLGVVLIDLGLVTAFLGGVSLLRPLHFLRIHDRVQGLAVLALGLIVITIGTLLPATEKRIVSPRTQLDQFVPVYQFSEFHSKRVAAPREQVYRVLKSVTADDILFFRTLTSIRRLGRAAPESILNPPAHEPLLDLATRTSFILLSEEPNREIVLGSLVAVPAGWRPSGEKTPERFQALLRQPGFAVAAMNFRMEDDGPGATLVTTETRVYATDAATRRRFAGYWRVIYPGSSLIRTMWLRAVARNAEAQRSQP
jgi:hypothetical protein